LNLGLLLLAAYALGSIPVGALVARTRGIDIFKVGSGNIGATNVIRAAGWRVGAVVFMADVLKGFLPTLAGRFLFPGHEWEWAAAGLAAALGHCFSPFLKFRGGKGVSCMLGMVLCVSPTIAAVTLITFVVVVAATRYVSLGSLLAVPSAAIAVLMTHHPLRVTAMFTAAALLTAFLHRKNIMRLLAGTELKFGGKKAA
jgi:glycerol-3-phosphate acyltransferase PlsY